MDIIQDQVIEPFVDLPHIPEWVYSHDFLCKDGNFNLLNSYKITPRDFSSFDHKIQQNLLIDDLLMCLNGFSGVYINKQCRESPSFSLPVYEIDEKIRSQANTTKEILKPFLEFSSHYSYLLRFQFDKSLPEYGAVNNALSEALNDFIDEIKDITIQIEMEHLKGKMCFAKLDHVLQESSRILKDLCRVLILINDEKMIGGHTLSVLHERILHYAGGVTKLHEFYFRLTKIASKPFFTILSNWLMTGNLFDPLGDFMICQTEMDDVSDDFVIWKDKYILLKKRIPSFLQHQSKLILNAGRYMNMLKLCSSDFKPSEHFSFEYSENSNDFILPIIDLCKQSSSALLNFMLKHRSLKDHLNSMNIYYLLDRSDFVSNFLNIASFDLGQPVSENISNRIQDHLLYALSISSTRYEQFNSLLKVCCDKPNLAKDTIQLVSGLSLNDSDSEINYTANILDAFYYDYSVKWPVKLVLNDSIVIPNFIIISRHLFSCKYVEYMLQNLFILSKTIRKSLEITPPWLTMAFILGQKMRQYAFNYYSYMQGHVIRPLWHNFMKKLTDSVDELNEALYTCLSLFSRRCFLENPRILGILMKLNCLCIQFSDFIAIIYQNFSNDSNRSLANPRVSSTNLTSKSFTSDFHAVNPETKEYLLSVAYYESEFNSLMTDLLEKLRQDMQIERIALISQLDFNNYYENLSVKSQKGSVSSVDDMSPNLLKEKPNLVNKLSNRYRSSLHSLDKSIFMSPNTVRRSSTVKKQSHLSDLRKSHSTAFSSKTQMLSKWISSIPAQEVCKRPSYAGLPSHNDATLPESLQTSIYSFSSRKSFQTVNYGQSEDPTSFGIDSDTIKPDYQTEKECFNSDGDSI